MLTTWEESQTEPWLLRGNTCGCRSLHRFLFMYWMSLQTALMPPVSCRVVSYLFSPGHRDVTWSSIYIFQCGRSPSPRISIASLGERREGKEIRGPGCWRPELVHWFWTEAADTENWNMEQRVYISRFFPISSALALSVINLCILY